MILISDPPTCVCSHGISLHEISTRKASLGQRTACSVYTGPRGTACGCAVYTERPPATTTGTAA